MSFVRHKAKNHPQQIAMRGVLDDIDDRRTPDDLFAKLHERFNFTIDVAANLENAKMMRWYGIDQDGLRQDWWQERVWCNPPFSNLEGWVKKAWRAMDDQDCRLIVMLVPATRTEQPWWQELVEPYRDGRLGLKRIKFTTEFLPGRVKFTNAKPAKRRSRPFFGCCLLIWSSHDT